MHLEPSSSPESGASTVPAGQSESTASAYPAGPSLPELGNALTWLLEQADLREVLRKSAQIVGARGSVALPRQIVAGARTSSPLHGLHVLVDVVGGTAPGSEGFALAMPVAQAAALVDLLLGGPGSPGLAANAGALGDAECGVLAYLAARCCAASGRALRVADVCCVPATQLLADWPAAVCWPVRVASDTLSLDLVVLFRTPSTCPAGLFVADVLVQDQLAATTLHALEAGDLLVSDRWLLTATSRGVQGPVQLRVPGCEQRLAASLEGDHLRVSGAAAPAEGAELVLLTLQLSFWQLAELASGAPLPLDPAWLERPVLLRAEGHVRLAGRLVQHAGGVALQASAVYSTR